MSLKQLLYSLKSKEHYMAEPAYKPFAERANQIEMQRWRVRPMKEGRISDLPESERRQALLARFHGSRSATSE
jgi:hypothetical protein